MKITSVKQILEDVELMKALEDAKSDEEMEKLVEKYDFSGFETSELNEEELEAVAGGLIMTQHQPLNPTWLQELAKKIVKKYINKPCGGGGGGGRGF